MTHFIACFRIATLFSLFASYCYAQELPIVDTYNADDWAAIKLPSLYRDGVPKMIESEDRESLVYSFDATPIQGKWLRVSAITAAIAPDIIIGTAVIDSSKARYNKYPPTQCVTKADNKICASNIWIAKTTDTIGIHFSWSKSKNFKLNNIRYEVAKNSILDSENEDRYKEILSKMARIYYRSNEVDWKNVALIGQQALVAPMSIDPLLGATVEVINRLPGNQETTILNNSISNPNIHPANSTNEKTSAKSDYMPTCEAINSSTWRLNLPGTETLSGNNWLKVNSAEYIEAAHKCLSNLRVTKWIVNLTKLEAGSWGAALAALAPLLGNGPVITRKNTASERKLLINNLNISEQDNVLMTWQNQFPPYKGQIDFILSKNCGNEVCGNIWLAVKEHGRTIGFQSSSIFVSNESIDINKTMHLQISHERTADANGKTYTKVDPHAVVDKKNLEKALRDELQ